MQSSLTTSALMLMATALVGGCVTSLQQTPTPYSAPYATPSQASYGSDGAIESIQVTRPGNTTSGTGAVVGGLVGNNVEQNSGAKPADRYQIRVRLDNGDSTILMQDSIDEMRVGNRVVITDGRATRY